MEKLKKLLPHGIAVVVFLILASVFLSPVFKGKIIRQSDVSTWQGMAQEIMEHREKYNDEPLWTNSMFGGMPAYQISVLYPSNLVQYLDKVVLLGLPSPVGTLFLYMAGFYFMLAVFRVDYRIAILSSIAFAFSTYFIIILEVGHMTKAHAIGYMAPVIAGIVIAYKGRILLGAAITGLALALQLLTNHLQITYYLFIMVAALGVVELINSIRAGAVPAFLKATGALMVAALLAVSTNITNLLLTEEYGKYSTRGPSELTADIENKTTGLDRDYITSWSYGISESFTFLVPDFKGGISEPIGKYNKDALNNVDSNYKQNVAQFGAYFGDQPFVLGPVYLGAIICLLFVIGLLLVKGDLKWWILVTSLLALMLAWGRHFMGLTNLFLDYVPGYNKFRTVSMTLVIVEFMFPLMAALVLDQLIKAKEISKEVSNRLHIGIGIVAGLLVLILIAPGMFTSFYTQDEYTQVTESVKNQNISADVIDGFFSAVESARKELLKADTIRSLVFVVLAGILLWGFVRFRFKAAYLVYGLLALVLLDLWTVNRRYLDEDDYVRKTAYKQPFPMTKANEEIRKDASTFRVFNLTNALDKDAATSYYHQSLGGYHGAKLKRYQELIEHKLSGEFMMLRNVFGSGVNAGAMQALSGVAAANMLNAKYIIYNSDAAPLINPFALGNAWFVNEYQMVANADSELSALNTFHPSQTAIVDARFRNQLENLSLQTDTTASVQLLSYKANELKYKSSSVTEGLVVFSEIYYDKGWNVYVDGVKSDYFRVNFILRGMRLKPGNHEIVWKFEPERYSTGETVSLVSSLLLLLGVTGIVLREARNARNKQENAA